MVLGINCYCHGSGGRPECCPRAVSVLACLRLDHLILARRSGRLTRMKLQEQRCPRDGWSAAHIGIPERSTPSRT